MWLGWLIIGKEDSLEGLILLVIVVFGAGLFAFFYCLVLSSRIARLKSRLDAVSRTPPVKDQDPGVPDRLTALERRMADVEEATGGRDVITATDRPASPEPAADQPPVSVPFEEGSDVLAAPSEAGDVPADAETLRLESQPRLIEPALPTVEPEPVPMEPVPEPASIEPDIPPDKPALSAGETDRPSWPEPLPSRREPSAHLKVPGGLPRPEEHPAVTSGRPTGQGTWIRKLLVLATNLIKTWITTGNVPVKVGVLISLLGLGFLLILAVEQGWITLSIGVRLIAAAMFGVVLLVLGWRVRDRNAIYGLSLQGGGIAVLYLTTYIAHAVYGLLPASGAALAVVVVTVGAGILAVAQDARSLAVLGIVGGFLAPILAYSEAKDHVLVFGFYTILTAAIVVMAWFKVWPELYLLGLGFTVGLTAFWLLTRYEIEDWSTTQPLIAILILLYMAIPLLFALRKTPDIKDLTTSPLVFGLPFVGLGFQYLLVDHYEYGVAISALVLAVIHSLFTLIARRYGRGWLALQESYWAMAAAFFAISVPLALDIQYVAVVWAIQGAVLVWSGTRRSRSFFVWGGALLQVLGTISVLSYFYNSLPYTDGVTYTDTFAFLNAGVFSFLADNLVYGPPVAAVTLAVVYTVLSETLRRSDDLAEEWRSLQELYLAVGMGFLLVAALLVFDSEFAVLFILVQGIVVVGTGIRQLRTSCVLTGYLVQIVGGAAFLRYLVNTLPEADRFDTDRLLPILVDRFGYMPALISTLLAIIYMAASELVRRSSTFVVAWRRLAETYLLVGMGLLTLAAFLTFDLEYVSAFWAIQGTVLVWIGIRQERHPPVWGGAILQLLAGGTFVVFLVQSLPYSIHTSILFNNYFLGAVLLAGTGLMTARFLERQNRRIRGQLEVPHVGLWWGIGWWLAGGLLEVGGQVPDAYRISVALVFVVASLGAVVLAAPLVKWPRLGSLAMLGLPAVAIPLIISLREMSHPFADYGWLAWMAALAIYYVVLRLRGRDFPTNALAMQIGGYWLLALLLGTEVYWQVDRIADGIWPIGATLGTFLTMVGATLWGRQYVWPVKSFWRTYLLVAAPPLLLLLAGWLFVLNLSSTANPKPLLYLPVLNPLEILTGLCLVALLTWKRLVNAEKGHALGDIARANWTPGLVVVLISLLTMTVARAIHHWLEVPFEFESMIGSTTLQAALSIVWGLAGLAGMVMGVRLVRRIVWVGGASLMGVVVVKLFLFDLSNTGTVARVVSFLGVGLLLLVVGYFAPVPPSASAQAGESTESPVEGDR